MSEKAQKVHQIFSEIAPRYDLANDVISFRRAHAWRRLAVELSGARDGQRVLDVATGTGDFAIAFKRAVGEKGEVIGVDFCQEMLKPAPNKAQALGLNIQFEQGDAMALRFADRTFDVVSIAYGLRNVQDPTGAVGEMARVLKDGGKLMILETGRSEWRLFKHAFDWYFGSIMPALGGWLSGSPGAYRYLDTSSKDFPYGAKLTELIERTGHFREIKAHPLFGGVSYIYECSKR